MLRKSPTPPCETPAGEKQPRYVIRPQDFGLNEINALVKQVQTSVLEAFGSAADTKCFKSLV